VSPIDQPIAQPIAEWAQAGPGRHNFSLRVGRARTLLAGDLDTARFAMLAMAGFAPFRGALRIDGGEVGDRPPHRRRVALIEPGLGLPASGRVRVTELVARAANGRQVVDAALDAACLTVEEADARLADLGDGARLRVALARTLVVDNRLLLLDRVLDALEPAALRAALLALTSIQSRLDIGVVVATARPAALLGVPIGVPEQIAAVVGGRVAQCAPPHTLYDDPVGPAVLNLLGPTNLLQARLLEVDPDGVARCHLPGGSNVEGEVVEPAPAVGGACRIDIRPERIALAAGDTLAVDGGLVGEVLGVSFEGAWATLSVRLTAGGTQLRVRRPAGVPLGRMGIGAEVSLAWQSHHARVWPAA